MPLHTVSKSQKSKKYIFLFNQSQIGIFSLVSGLNYIFILKLITIFIIFNKGKNENKIFKKELIGLCSYLVWFSNYEILTCAFVSPRKLF